MSKNFLDRAEFKTKKIQSSTILRNFDESVNKDTGGIITEKTLPLNIQIRDHKETITFRIILAMRDLYLKQSWLRKWNSRIDWIKLTVLMQNRYLTSRKEGLKMTIEDRSVKKRISRKELIWKMSFESAKIEQISKDYRDFEGVFENLMNKDALVAHRRWDHSIEFMKEKNISDDYVRTLSEKERKIVKDHIDENLKKSYIRSSKASAEQSIIFASKSDNEIRLCIDFRKLNDIIKKRSSALSLMTDLQRQIVRVKWFTQLDLRNTFHLIRMKESDKWKTVFKTEFELFEYTIMSFELKNASTTFQTIISKILQKYLKNFVITYLNDIAVYSNTLKKHKLHVKKVLKTLQKAGLRLKLKKCKFHVQRSKFLRWILLSESIEINSDKLDSILTYSRPKTEKQLLQFLEMTVFFKNAISEYSHKTVSLTDLLRKDIKFIWTKEQEQAF